MLDLNRTLFYKASFDVEAVVGDDVLWPVLFEIKNWMVNKWRSRGVELPAEDHAWSDLRGKGRGRIESCDSDRSVVVESQTYYDGVFGDKWACAVTETFREKGFAPREWRTDVGFSWHGGRSGTCSLVLTYADQPGFLGTPQPTPGPSVPGLVGRLMRNERIRCTVSGRPLTMDPILLNTGDAPAFWEFVADPRRVTPVVFVSPLMGPEGATFALDPVVVARALGPAAFVYFANDASLMTEMMACIPDTNLRCLNGTVRIYTPGKSLSEHWRHRFFTRAFVEEVGQDALVAIMRRALAQNVMMHDGITRLDDVRALVRRSSFANQKQRDVDALRKEAGETREELDAFLEDHESALAIVDELDRQVDELKLQMASERARANYFEQRANAAGGKGSVPHATLGRYPDREGVIRLFLEQYPDRIDLSKRAWKSLDECEASIEVLWNGLYYICTLLYGLWRNNKGIDIEKAFNDAASGYEYKRGEGMQSRIDKALMASRRDTYDGREIFAEPHVCKGNFKGKDRGKSIRIYLAFDEVSGRIVLSSIGKHLDNYSTQHRH